MLIVAALFLANLTPVPPAADLKAAFAVLNATRTSLGLAPFRWDARLARAAQESADELQGLYARGYSVQDVIHRDLDGRVRRAGFPILSAIPPRGRRGTGNVSECGPVGELDPRAPGGWGYRPRPAVEIARRMAWMFGTPPKLPLNEAHVVDFRAGYTHAGLGHAGGFLVTVYGYLPPGYDDGNPPVPKPPAPAIDFAAF